MRLAEFSIGALSNDVHHTKFKVFIYHHFTLLLKSKVNSWFGWGNIKFFMSRDCFQWVNE